MKILLKGGRVVDPCINIDDELDILIEGDRIREVGKDINVKGIEVFDVKGKVVVPGFIDLHVHLRDPGQTYKEDIESGLKCAVAGGFTTILCMPNTNPPVDTAETVKYIIDKAERVGLCEVLPCGTVTKGRKGKELSNMYLLKEAGCIAFTDDGSPVQDALLMKRALQIAKQLDTFIMNHCEDDSISYGHINEGYIHALTGIAPRSPEAEEIMIARDCILSLKTEGHIHIQHVSSSLSVEIIRHFKDKGAPITAEVNPMHLYFTEEVIKEVGSNGKVNPPLRREEDKIALIEALREGIIDCVATDHAPHAPHEKGLIEESMPGMIGLQTALPIMLELKRQGYFTLNDIVRFMSCNPARIISKKDHGIHPGNPANLTVFDENKEWILDENTNYSKSRNTPLWKRRMKGKVIMTIYMGKVVFKDQY